MTLRSLVLPFAAAMLLAACAEKPQPEAQLPAVLVRAVGAAAALDVALYTGDVHARHEAALGFRVPGKLTARLVDAGARVRKGQVLARLDPADLQLSATQARAELAAAEADLRLARSEFERAASLVAQNFQSEAVLDAKRTTLQAAEARLGQARAGASLAGNQTGYATLEADRDGVVTTTLAEPGQVLAAGQPVLHLAQDGAREVLINIPESRLAQVSVGTAARVRPWADQSRTFGGTVREVAPAADVATRTYAVKVTIDASEAALPLGATAMVGFAGEARGALLVPLSAVSRDAQEPVVWVLDAAAGTVAPRKVEVVSFREDGALIRGELSAAEQIVVRGAPLLRAGQKVRPVLEDAPVSLDARR
ncbi:MAG: efflux RND transporter periplasmic adaptor subunit [Rhodocyclaceae bacterium]